MCHPLRKGRRRRKKPVSGEDDAVGSVSWSWSQGSLWEQERSTGAKEMEATLERRTPHVGKSHTVLQAVTSGPLVTDQDQDVRNLWLDPNPNSKASWTWSKMIWAPVPGLSVEDLLWGFTYPLLKGEMTRPIAQRCCKQWMRGRMRSVLWKLQSSVIWVDMPSAGCWGGHILRQKVRVRCDP